MLNEVAHMLLQKVNKFDVLKQKKVRNANLMYALFIQWTHNFVLFLIEKIA